MLVFGTRVGLAATLQLDDFQGGTLEGWSGGASPTLQTSGGPAGSGDAFLQIRADAPVGPGSNLAVHNVSPDWMGDYRVLNVTAISVDLMSPINSVDLQMRVVLFGPLTADQRWTSQSATLVPNDGAWRNYEFSLAADDLTRVLGTSSYESLMAGVVRVMIRHDAGTPSAGGTSVAGSLGIDNIRLVTNTPHLATDFDGDGDVDHQDLAQWERDFGQNGGSDADADGDSDGADFLAWQRTWAPTTNITASAAPRITIPEPGTGGLAVLLAFGSPFTRALGPQRHHYAGGRRRRGFPPSCSCSAKRCS
jgi:hypothetical protein